jgi:hypothetical protein
MIYTKYSQEDEVKGDLGGTRNREVGIEKCAQNFDRKF